MEAFQCNHTQWKKQGGMGQMRQVGCGVGNHLPRGDLATQSHGFCGGTTWRKSYSRFTSFPLLPRFLNVATLFAASTATRLCWNRPSTLRSWRSRSSASEYLGTANMAMCSPVSKAYYQKRKKKKKPENKEAPIR